MLNQADSPDECEKLYEQSLWCLYALQDELLQEDNPFMDEDRNTIATCESPMLTILLYLYHSYIPRILDRDQTYETTPNPMPCPNDDERPRPTTGRSPGQES